MVIPSFSTISTYKPTSFDGDLACNDAESPVLTTVMMDTFYSCNHFLIAKLKIYGPIIVIQQLPSWTMREHKIVLARCEELVDSVFTPIVVPTSESDKERIWSNSIPFLRSVPVIPLRYADPVVVWKFITKLRNWGTPKIPLPIFAMVIMPACKLYDSFSFPTEAVLRCIPSIFVATIAVRSWEKIWRKNK